MTETLYCYPCNMTFRVEAPARNKPEAEHTTCECGRHFWHSGAHGDKPARVGVWPKDVEAIDMRGGDISNRGDGETIR